MITREQAIAHLKSIDQGAPDNVEEYINEAEHQDGEEYWDQFDDLEDLTTDYNLYWDSIAGTDEDDLDDTEVF